MKKNKFLALLATCLAPTVLIGCAADPDTSFSTEPSEQYEITYLLTNFEAENHANAEGIYRQQTPMGYHYIFDDPNTTLDYVEPHAKESPLCRTTEGLSPEQKERGDTDRPFSPAAPGCSIRTGFEVNQDNPFTYFGSTRSFHMKGVVAGEGLGFGTYFSDFNFLPFFDPDDRSRRLRDENGNLPATFTPGRRNEAGEYICADDEDFAGVIDPAFATKSDTDLFYRRFENDTDGKYEVTGSVYTAGYIWEDTDGNENYELSYKNKDKLKEPRCLASMGQEGFVMWATGNTKVEVTLNLPETSPLTDGGICDEEGGEKCYDFHKVTFELDGAWREYHASWDEFVQEGWGKPVSLDPNKIINLQIKVAPPLTGTREFDLWIDHIGFYGGTKWEFVEKLADTEWLIEDTATGSDTTPVDTNSDVDTGTDTGTDTGADTGDTDTTTDDTDTNTDDTGTDTVDTDTNTDTNLDAATK